jgi:hypothetical protein
MSRILFTGLTAMVWLLASPSLQLRDAGWVEVGATPAAAQTATAQEPAPTAKKKSSKKAHKPARIGSSGIVLSNQPPKYPMQEIPPPQMPQVTGTVTTLPRDPRYPNVPTLPILPRGATGGAGAETSQDRVVRCTQQGALGGLTPGQQGAYIGTCAF